MTSLSNDRGREVGFAARGNTTKSNKGIYNKQAIAITAALVAFVAVVALVLSTAHKAPTTIRENGNLVDITGYDAAMKLGEENDLKVRVRVNGIKVADTYSYARTQKNNTNDVRVVVIVHPGDVVEKRWWRWHYTPATR